MIRFKYASDFIGEGIMRKMAMITLLGILLVGCKLGGKAENITGSVTIQDTVTGEELTLSEDGAFRFDHNYDAGEPYLVEITETSSGLVCHIEGNEGIFTGENIKNIKIECDLDAVACTQQYDPVCAKVEADLRCITEPCITHEYRSFGNACSASASKAQIAFIGECDGLKGQVAFGDRPVYIKEGVLDDDIGADYKLVNSDIRGDIAYVTLQHSGGCGEHDFQLNVANVFENKDSVTAMSVLYHEADDDCEALIKSEQRFDLLPVKEFYSRQFNSDTGAVLIEGIGLYRF